MSGYGLAEQEGEEDPSVVRVPRNNKTNGLTVLQTIKMAILERAGEGRPNIYK